MTRKQLEQFVEDRFNRISNASNREQRDKLFTQAFGGVEFFCMFNPNLEADIADWWNNTQWTKFMNAVMEG